MIRTGLGFDVHPLTEGRKLFIGGVHIPHAKGAEGHSDADVLIHAICDALLGAAALGDIGRHFPDSEMRYKDMESSFFLKAIARLISEKGFKINNIDATVCLERPLISPFIEKICMHIASCLGIDVNQVSVKATRGEKLGFIGREEGVTALANVLIEEK